MNRKTKTVLTAMIIVVIAAIYAVGLFLLWDFFGIDGKLDDLMEKDLYEKHYYTESNVPVNVKLVGKEITDEEGKLISDYFVYYYAGLGALKAEKIARFYIFECNDELFDEMALDYEIFLASECPIDMTFRSCDLTVNITRRHGVPKSNKTEIDIKLTASVEGGAAYKVKNEIHSFVVEKNGKALQIAEHTTERFSRTAAEKELDAVLAARKYTRSDLNYTFFPKYTAIVLENLEKARNSVSMKRGNTDEFPAAEILYDREKAVYTAVNGVSDDGIFDTYPENDANYISRCIFESGIPMDSQGERYDQWKWYDSEQNYERRKTGCTKSWYDRQEFYRYVTENSGFGLAGCEAEKGGGALGDIVQIMSDGKPVQELMITGIIAGAGGNTRDYFVSNDRFKSVPLLTLGYTDFRVLHISGHNTANI